MEESAQIEAIFQVNDQIISRIKSKESEYSKSNIEYSLQFFEKDHQFRITPRPLSASAVIKKYRSTATFLEIDNVFNIPMTPSPTTFHDITQYHDDLKSLFKKFSLFVGSTHANQELAKIKLNVDIIQNCLGDVEQALATQENAQLEQELEMHTSLINQHLKSLQLLGVQFKGNALYWEWGERCPNVVLKGRVMDRLQPGYAIAYLNHQCAPGCTWSIMVNDTYTWLAFGVATKPSLNLTAWSGREDNWYLYSQNNASAPGPHCYPPDGVVKVESGVIFEVGDVIIMEYAEEQENLLICRKKTGNTIVKLCTISNLPQNVWPIVISYVGTVTLQS